MTNTIAQSHELTDIHNKIYEAILGRQGAPIAEITSAIMVGINPHLRCGVPAIQVEGLNHGN